MASSSSSSSATSSSSKPADPFDGLLAGAGYKVRSSDLHRVALRLELLDSTPSLSPSPPDDTCRHYNPSDLASWVDSLLSDNNPTAMIDPHPVVVPEHRIIFPPHLDTDTDEEDSGIRLVHLLMSCADSVQRNDTHLAAYLISQMHNIMTRVNSFSGIGKVASHFIHALTTKLLGPSQKPGPAHEEQENEILYHHFYEACPYLKFAHFTANQAILEAFDGRRSVHVVDFSLKHGLQWPALIQALALRPGGPPTLRLTGIGPPSPDGRDALREIGLRLAELARGVGVPFAFRGVAASRLDDVEPWMLQTSPHETLAINSVCQLHRLLGPGQGPARVLSWMRALGPHIVTLVEQEADHNQPLFLDRFTEALYYYSTLFDSLEACSAQAEKALAEMYIQKEICNVVCCEGAERVERHEPLDSWRARLAGAGFRPVHMGMNAYKQASMLLTLFSAEGYCVEEREGCLTLGWHNRPLIAASAWQAVPDPNPQLGFSSPSSQ